MKGDRHVYTFALTTCAMIFGFCALAIIFDKLFDRYIFEPLEEDFNDEWWGIE